MRLLQFGDGFIEGLLDLTYDPEMIEFFRIGTAFMLVLIGFALTDWGQQDD